MTTASEPQHRPTTPCHVVVTGQLGTGMTAELVSHLRRRAAQGAEIWARAHRRARSALARRRPPRRVEHGEGAGPPPSTEDTDPRMTAGVSTPRAR